MPHCSEVPSRHCLLALLRKASPLLHPANTGKGLEYSLRLVHTSFLLQKVGPVAVAPLSQEDISVPLLLESMEDVLSTQTHVTHTAALYCCG